MRTPRGPRGEGAWWPRRSGSNPLGAPELHHFTPGRFHKVPDGLSRLPATHLNRLPPDARGRAAVPSEGGEPT
jgi:hypothetical protein